MVSSSQRFEVQEQIVSRVASDGKKRQDRPRCRNETHATQQVARTRYRFPTGRQRFPQHGKNCSYVFRFSSISILSDLKWQNPCDAFGSSIDVITSCISRVGCAVSYRSTERHELHITQTWSAPVSALTHSHSTHTHTHMCKHIRTWNCMAT